MTPDQIWRTARRLLENDIPRSAFLSHVQDMDAGELTENTLVLICPSEYTREWADQRLGSMIRRMLVGICGRNLDVRFEVKTPSKSLPEAAPIPSPALSPEVQAKLDSTRISLAEAMTRPERVTVVPRYFLRWLPFLEPGQAWLFVALCQAFYQAHGRKVIPGRPFQASAATLARWSGLSRRTVISYLQQLEGGDPPTALQAFVERIDPPEARRSGRPACFRFKAVVPLTPPDRLHLKRLLRTLGFASNPEAALRQALQMPHGELVAAQGESGGQGARALAGILPGLPGQADPSVQNLARQLADRVIAPEDVLLIRHYFLLHWLRRLGSGPAWLVTLLRAAGYDNRRTGEKRGRITVRDGCAGLAAALGLQRVNTVMEWLPAHSGRALSELTRSPGGRRRAATRAEMARFVKVAARRTGRRQTPLELQVAMADPLVADHQSILERLIGLYATTADDPERANLWRWLCDGQPAAARSAPPVRRDFTSPDAEETAICTALRRDVHTSAPAESRDLHTLKDSINKYFNQERVSLQHILTTPCDSEQRADPAVPEETPAGGEGWDYDRLLQLGGSDPARRKSVCRAIRRRPELGARLLAWLIYGHEQRRTLQRPSGIDSPFAFALSRFERQVPPFPHSRLARQGPHELLRRLRAPLENWGQTAAAMQLYSALADNGFLEVLEELCA